MLQPGKELVVISTVARRIQIPMSNTFGNFAKGSAPTTVATRPISMRLLRRLPRIWLAIHSSTSVSTRHRQTGRGRRMMHHRLGQQVVKTPIVASLGRGVVDLKQRLGFCPADRLMFDRARRQDTRAPGGVIGVECAGEMNAALGGGAFSGDHAIAYDGQRTGSGVSAGNVRGFEDRGQFDGGR
jgi:hypothetical protein